MWIEEEIKKEILGKFGKELNLVKIEVKVTMLDKPPSPGEVAPKGAILEFLGRVESGFIYAIKKGLVILGYICTLSTISDLPEKYNLYIPRAYDFIVDFGKQLIDGKTDAVRVSDKKEDGYLVLKPDWINDRHSFENDHSNSLQGNFEYFNDQHVAYIPASGLSGSIVNGTSPSTNFPMGS